MSETQPTLSNPRVTYELYARLRELLIVFAGVQDIPMPDGMGTTDELRALCRKAVDLRATQRAEDRKVADAAHEAMDRLGIAGLTKEGEPHTLDGRLAELVADVLNARQKLARYQRESVVLLDLMETRRQESQDARDKLDWILVRLSETVSGDYDPKRLIASVRKLAEQTRIDAMALSCVAKVLDEAGIPETEDGAGTPRHLSLRVRALAERKDVAIRPKTSADLLAEEVESVHQALRDAHVYGPESAAQKIAALHKRSIVGENYRIALDDAKHQIDTLRAELNALKGGAS